MKRLILPLLLVVLLASCLPETPDATTTLGAGIDIVSVGDEWVDGGCEVTIDDQTFAMTTTTNVDTTVINETTVIYTYETDEAIYQCQRVVMVIDNVAPTIELLPGVDTITRGETWTDAGVTFTDNLPTLPELTVSGFVDIGVAGTYQIIYTATDTSGNSATVVRVVTVTE